MVPSALPPVVVLSRLCRFLFLTFITGLEAQTGNPTKMTSHLKARLDLRVPDELWLEIFLYLPREDLFPLHAVSCTFHRIARPLLFATFAFHPYAVTTHQYSAFRYLLPNEAQIKRALRRLQFWASDEIASLVQRCTVSPLQPSGNVEYTPCYDGRMILTNFFQLLPRFKNIKELSFHHVQFDETTVASLASLRSLRTLEVQRCLAPDMEAVPFPSDLIKVTKFQLKDTEFPSDIHKWLLRLDRQILSHLILGSDAGADADAIIALPFTFPNVHTLSIFANRLQELAFVNKFPAVRYLALEPIQHLFYRLSSPPLIVLPDLESYKGPPEFLKCLDPTPRPGKLEIFARIVARFLNATRGIHHAHLVTSLLVHLDLLETGTFRSLLGLFTSLVEFHLVVGHPDVPMPSPSAMYTEETLFMDLSTPPTPFPSTLTTLSIVWLIASQAPVEDVIAAARTAGSALAVVSMHSNLRSIELSWGEMKYEWKRDLDLDLDGQLRGERVENGSDRVR